MSEARPGHHRGTAMSQALAGVLCLLLISGCVDEQKTKVAGPDVRAVIDPWLLCQECTDGELDSLTALGKLVPETVESLSTDLLAGPAPTRLANIKQQLEESFSEDTAYENSNGGTPRMSSADYVQLYAGNYVAVYRARAAVGLAGIGGGRAGAALDSAIAGQVRPPSEPLRPDVQRAAEAAKDTLYQ